MFNHIFHKGSTIFSYMMDPLQRHGACRRRPGSGSPLQTRHSGGSCTGRQRDNVDMSLVVADDNNEDQRAVAAVTKWSSKRAAASAAAAAAAAAAATAANTTE